MITKEDVKQTADSIGMEPTDEDVQLILNEYPSWEKQDLTATWNLIVEDMLYYFLLPL